MYTRNECVFITFYFELFNFLFCAWVALGSCTHNDTIQPTDSIYAAHGALKHTHTISDSDFRTAHRSNFMIFRQNLPKESSVRCLVRRSESPHTIGLPPFATSLLSYRPVSGKFSIVCVQFFKVAGIHFGHGWCRLVWIAPFFLFYLDVEHKIWFKISLKLNF